MSYTQGYEQDLELAQRGEGCVCDYDVACPAHPGRDLYGCGDGATEPKATVCTLLASKMDELGLRGLWLPNVRVSRAKASGTNPGALYLKSQFGDYLGKITATGEIRTIVQLDPAVKNELRAFVKGGRDYLNSIGKETGQCCYCGLQLTDPDSVVRGYGPVCAKKYGLDHPNRSGF